jgi:hypothetical protein
VPSLLVGALVVTGLEPFSWSQAPGRFAWIPFAGSLEAEPAAGLTVLLQKGFRYGAAVWLLCLAGVPARWAAGGVATVLAGVELAQTHLPGRTAEITDPLIALLMAWGFNQLSRRDSKPSGSVARASIVPSSAGEREVERSAG